GGGRRASGRRCDTPTPPGCGARRRAGGGRSRWCCSPAAWVSLRGTGHLGYQGRVVPDLSILLALVLALLRLDDPRPDPVAGLALLRGGVALGVGLDLHGFPVGLAHRHFPPGRWLAGGEDAEPHLAAFRGGDDLGGLLLAQDQLVGRHGPDDCLGVI